MRSAIRDVERYQRRHRTNRCTVAAPANLSSTLSGFFLVACNRARHGELKRYAELNWLPDIQVNDEAHLQMRNVVHHPSAFLWMVRC